MIFNQIESKNIIIIDLNQEEKEKLDLIFYLFRSFHNNFTDIILNHNDLDDDTRSDIRNRLKTYYESNTDIKTNIPFQVLSKELFHLFTAKINNRLKFMSSKTKITYITYPSNAVNIDRNNKTIELFKFNKIIQLPKDFYIPNNFKWVNICYNKNKDQYTLNIV